MICPKCGSRHIIDTMCVMCGTLVHGVVEAPERTCLSCGRKERFIGSVCKDCGEAIAKGAMALKKAAQRNFSQDKDIVIAECPAIPVLNALWEKFHARREHRRAKQKEYELRYREAHREEIRAASKTEQYKAWRKAHDKKPEIAEKHRQRWRRRYAERMKDEEFRARRTAYAQQYRERKKAEDPQWYEQYLAKCREYKKAHPRKEHWDPDKRREWARKRREENPEIRRKENEYSRAYYWAHREQVLARQRRDREEERLRRENEKLDMERKHGTCQWTEEDAGGTSCGDEREIWLGGLGSGEPRQNQLGVDGNGGMQAPEGPQVAEARPV